MKKDSLTSSVFGLSKYMLNDSCYPVRVNAFGSLLVNVSSLMLGLGRPQRGKQVLRLMDLVRRKQSRT